MCPWVVSGCRSRRASPAVQRSRDLLFLNRTRSSRTGPSARRAEPRHRKGRWPRGGASETATRSGARTFTSRAPCEGPSQCPEPRKGCSEGGRGSPMMEGTSDRGARRPSLGGRAETVSVVSEWLPSKRGKADAVTEVPEVRSRGARGEENAPRLRREGKEERDPPKRSKCREALRSSNCAEPLWLRREGENRRDTGARSRREVVGSRRRPHASRGARFGNETSGESQDEPGACR